MEKHNSEWMTGGPRYNRSISKKLYGNVSEGFIRNSRTDRYNIMCSIYANEKEHQSYCDDGSIGGGCPLPSNSTTRGLYLLGATMDFIGYWLKTLEHSFIEGCNMYVF